MKEIGEELKQLRKKSGVDLEEASHDLNISEIELECIEAGNAKAFKDIYELKDKVRLYAKYLGVDEDKIADEFNDFLFEKTSKISLNDVKKIKEEKKKTKEEDDDRVSSPYTKIKVNKYEVAPVVFGVIALLLIALVLYIVLKVVKNNSDDSRELMVMEDIYELTK
jgi:cytoskeletal protein RodZ